MSEASFEREVLAADGPVLVDFWAPWCTPCRTMRPLVEDVAEEYASAVRVVALDVRTAPAVAARYGGRTLPLLILFEGGAIRARIAGTLSRTRLCAFIESTLASP